MKGLDGVLGQLQGLVNQAESALENALQETGAEALRYAQGIVPVRTGRLQASIMMVRSGMQMRVETHCPYAGFVELGTRYAAAQPYLRPAARETDYFGMVSRALKEILK